MAIAALRLNNTSQSATISDALLPYEAKLTRLDGLTSVFAVSLDESSDITITAEGDKWLRDSNDNLLFDSNSLLLEADE